MSVPWQPARDSRGLLLVRAKPGPVSGWVRRGLVACDVVPLGEWTALLPAERSSRARAPYDDAVTVLAGRPVPLRLRPSIGVFVIDHRAVVSLQAKGFRAGHRWLVWEPENGPLRTPGLDPARPPELVAAAHSRTSPSAVHAVLKDGSGDALRYLRRVLEVLSLPGGDLLAPSDHPRGQVVAPTAQAVARFESRMAEQAQHRAELEES
ncbi:hypothetical protein [Phycicoccus sp. Root101]|uniref:hypothetical protein n=1 Tax=Phycicoccus sp. Root101 TaxID=1736421 RepID=UPI000702AA7E|nr:hypothetical protein [Phycicoccus sp. Root101]KQU66258.1 hypothetical protein ASC58_14380 [Phycicoccus sp. Root101]